MSNESQQCSVGKYLARRLEQAGVKHYFTVPGDFTLVLHDQLLKNPRLQLIGCGRRQRPSAAGLRVTKAS